MHFALRAVGLPADGIGIPPSSLGEGLTVSKLIKKGHQLRGLWPKTSGRMTLMRHFVCYCLSTLAAKLYLLNLNGLTAAVAKITGKTFRSHCNVYKVLVGVTLAGHTNFRLAVARF